MSTWAQRAAAAEDAVLHHHLRPLWGLPGTALGLMVVPPAPEHRTFAKWCYWWQAHLLDCLVDAATREPDPQRTRRVREVARGIQVRNLGSWTNSYYDDMAWLALALQRADTELAVAHPRGSQALLVELQQAYQHAGGQGIPWRRGDDFRNTPANGPAAILFARSGRVSAAADTADWLHTRLLDPATGLVCDGLRPGEAGAVVEATKYTYCQGVVLGAETELAVRTGAAVHARRVHRLVRAVQTHLAPSGVPVGAGGGDGGLFAGILARYLAVVARQLPGDDDADAQARATARRLVLSSADAAWRHRDEVAGRPVFGPSWEQPPLAGRRDLSVQLSAWMLLEAAATLPG